MAEVRWNELSHAYGPAGDVPAMLAGVRSPERREKAVEELWSSLCHQSTVYPASAAAVPFLAELALDADVPGETRCIILALVVHIGIGEDTCWEGYQPLEVALEAQRAVRAVAPRLLAAAPGQPPGWRALCVALCAYFPDLECDPAALVDDAAEPAHVAARRLAVALRRGVGLDRALAEAASFDEDVAEYEAESLAGRPPERRARQVVLELASRA